MSAADLYEKMARLAREGEAFVVATIIGVEGSTPRHLGAKMLVLRSGETFDTIGGGPLERQVVSDALHCLEEGASRTERYGLREEGERALGALCGGDATVFLEVHAPEHSLLIVGAGHVGQALARAAEPLGYRVVVLDPREELLTRDRFPSVHELVCGDPAQVPAAVPVDASTHVVLVSHSHVQDKEALRAVVASDAASIGMMGSAKKVRRIFSELREEGVPDTALARVRAPIGLDIGAETPAELALSILAEIVADRRGRAGGRMESPPEAATAGGEGGDVT
jgi:xanthine dehydrogenase accessory factor